MALAGMMDAAPAAPPDAVTANAVTIGRTMAGRAAIRTAELAVELVGGAAFYRSRALERPYRDVQGARIHPLRGEARRLYAGSSPGTWRGTPEGHLQGPTGRSTDPDLAPAAPR
jgi:acyl-CoA dehydrogenase